MSLWTHWTLFVTEATTWLKTFDGIEHAYEIDVTDSKQTTNKDMVGVVDFLGVDENPLIDQMTSQRVRLRLGILVMVSNPENRQSIINKCRMDLTESLMSKQKTDPHFNGKLLSTFDIIGEASPILVMGVNNVPAIFVAVELRISLSTA